ncbi:epithelial chloride channel protein [Nephila pilipes]|uniref:Epithelial chloride channel protein n=1 Tax=Nephila pilipes TaxID=299642 RepID=A0A8X6T1P4_NEPPI|nr:epithelial chloride channel protein [Nephila pilipes]
MMKRILCLCVVACLTILLGVKAEVKVENGAYQDVLLSFAPNVPSDTTQEQIKSLKELLESTSQALYAATGIRIGTVKVRLPSTWHTSWEGETISLASPEQTEQKPDILVDATEDSAFGKKPIALQHGGCTMPGHQIALPMKFVSSSEDYPKGKLLAREWLKYRYGVFDENGFEGDQMYPEYYRVPGSSDIRITECTNPEVNFYFKNPKTGNNCSMDKPDEFGTCKALPEQDANVTSSLMYFHKDLAAMEHICDRENHTHKDNTPSKHNTLCNGESIWDILNKSSDFTSGGSSEEYQPVEFSLIQDRNPRVVLSYENSDVLFVKEDVISLGVMRLLYDLPSQSKVGVYYFTKSVSESRPFADLSNRDVVNGLGDFGYLVKDICVSCALNQAVDVLLEDTSAGAEGTIILITHSKFEGDISNLKTKVENSRLCLTLIRFVDEESGEENLDQLKEAFPCNSLHEIKINEENGQSFENFYSYMNTFIPQPTYDYQVEAMPVIIYVKINYGRYPITEASVTGIVTAPNNENKEVQFFDNGKGDPDITKHDGLYSGYFTNFVDAGDYSLSVTVSHKEGQTMIGKKGADICCGSQVKSEMFTVPSFELKKSIVIKSKSKKPDDGYPPSRILDLKISKFDPPNTIDLEWTAPGGGEVASYILKLFNSRDEALKNFGSSGKVLDTIHLNDSYHDKQEKYELSPGEFEDNATYYIALQALNAEKKGSETSTILEFYIPFGTRGTATNQETSTAIGIEDDPKKSGPSKKTIGIVIGVLGGIVVLCICIYLGIYFFVQKPKREAEEEARAKRNENGSGQRSSSSPSGQIGLNSIPADVIIKHHNEVVTAKNLHKDPPIFKEENLDSFNSSPELPENSTRNNNVPEYSQVQKASSHRTPDSSQQDPSKSPKRMTIV